MTRYQYKSVLLEMPREPGFWSRPIDRNACMELEKMLNYLGEDGWELVGVFPLTNGGNPSQINAAVHHFKRPIEGE